MSLTRRLFDLARTNLNTLLEKAAETADPHRRLAGLSDEELEAELSRRRASRETEARLNEAKARVEAGAPKAGAVPRDRAERERQAREREARVRAARQAREREAARGSRTPPSAQEQRRQSQAPPRRPQNPQLATFYARLELPYGAGWDEVKSAYRRLMRRYHPDLHAGSPEKQRAANEVARALTEAYNELDRHLSRR